MAAVDEEVAIEEALSLWLAPREPIGLQQRWHGPGRGELLARC